MNIKVGKIYPYLFSSGTDRFPTVGMQTITDVGDICVCGTTGLMGVKCRAEVRTICGEVNTFTTIVYDEKDYDYVNKVRRNHYVKRLRNSILSHLDVNGVIGSRLLRRLEIYSYYVAKMVDIDDDEISDMSVTLVKVYAHILNNSSNHNEGVQVPAHLVEELKSYDLITS